MMRLHVSPSLCLPGPATNSSTRSQISGLALTGGGVYLALFAQRQNRQSQHALISQQTSVLHAIADRRDPYSAYADSRRALAADEGAGSVAVAEPQRAGIVETCKDMWNAEIEGTVRRVEGWRWGDVWARWAAAWRERRKE